MIRLSQEPGLSLRAASLALLPLIAACGGEESAEIDTAGLCRGVVLPSGYVAKGLCVRAVASQQGALRQITFSPDGDLLGAGADGRILRYRDSNDDGRFEGDAEVVEIANTGGDNGNNVHLADSFLYAGSLDGVKRWAYSTDADDLGAADDVVVGQPATGTHKLHTVHVYDGWLYVHSGSEDNAVAPASPEYDTNRATLKRFKLADFESGTPFQWSDGEVFVTGIRNMVGFTQNAAGRMYGVINGMDSLIYASEDVHLNNPGDDLLQLEAGVTHGYPYCFTAQHIKAESGMVPVGTQLAAATDPEQPDPDFDNPHDDAWCAENSKPPATFTTAHGAALDIVFLDEASDALPPEWTGGAFVALHGSWDTTPSVGHKVVFIPFDEDGNAPMPTTEGDKTSFPYTTVFGGGSSAAEHDGIWGWKSGDYGEDPVRPVGVAISPVDGALYVSSDNAGIAGGATTAKQGVLYRIRLDE